MSAMQRNKGKTGEREAAGLVRDLTGWDVRRRVRQHDGDSDLVGVPGWSIEVKRRRSATHADLARWWAQAVAQAGADLPVLLYRVDRGEWRAVWPLAALLATRADGEWLAYGWTTDSSLAGWAAVARHLVPPKHRQPPTPTVTGAAAVQVHSCPPDGVDRARELAN